MSEQNQNRLMKVLLRIAIPVLEIAVFLYLMPRLIQLFFPFVVGWILALIATPLVKFLEKKLKLVRKHSSVIIIIAVLALVLGVLYALVSWIFTQSVSLAKELPQLYQSFSMELKEIFLQYDHIFAMLPETVQQYLQRITGNIGEAAGMLVHQMATPTVEVAGMVAKRIPNVMIGTIVIICSAYMFIVDQDKIHATLKQYAAPYIPKGWKLCWKYICEDGKSLIGGYFLAQLRIMLVIAVVLTAGFLILQVRYGLLLGILVAILDFLPLFGTGTVLIPWAVFELFSRSYSLAAGLLLLNVLAQVMRQVIQPKIVGETLGLSPMWTLIFLYLGFQWHGVSGMILAVPLGIMAMRLVEHGLFEEWLESIKELIDIIQKYIGHS